MEYSFEIGQHVQLKTTNELYEEFGFAEYELIHKACIGEVVMYPALYAHLGEEVRIVDVDTSDNTVFLDSIGWCSFEMIRPIDQTDRTEDGDVIEDDWSALVFSQSK